jgi:(p)ppGpp synthase/HD superfamily hydrolase
LHFAGFGPAAGGDVSTVARVVALCSRYEFLTDRLPQTRAAIAFAERVHRGQHRKTDGAPFILHPLEVSSLLYDAGAPDHLIAAGALHDTLEKTDVTGANLRVRFGERVAGLVQAVSEDPRIKGYTHRKAELRERVATSGEEALTLFAADKLAKVRELRLEGVRPGGRRPGSSTAPAKRDRRLAHYLGCLSLLEANLPESPLVRALHGELELLGRRWPAQPLLASTR